MSTHVMHLTARELVIDALAREAARCQHELELETARARTINESKALLVRSGELRSALALVMSGEIVIEHDSPCRRACASEATLRRVHNRIRWTRRTIEAEAHDIDPREENDGEVLCAERLIPEHGSPDRGGAWYRLRRYSERLVSVESISDRTRNRPGPAACWAWCRDLPEARALELDDGDADAVSRELDDAIAAYRLHASGEGART